MVDKKGHALLITYYWPPAGGAGVHRWLRFSKYFKQNAWDLTVYCPSDAVWSVRDEGLLSQVSPELTIIKRPIFEPNKYLGKAGKPGVGLSHDKDPGLIKKMLVWVRGNLFIPDARAFWIKPSVKFLEEYLKQHPEINTIISTGPPHSMHVIALHLKRKLGIRWVADFRDPWTQIDFYQQLSMGKRADKKQRALEKQCLTEADEVVTVSESWANGLHAIANRSVHVISNGYEFTVFDRKKVVLDADFTIAHFGSMPASRNPELLWRVLKSFADDNHEILSDLKIELYGGVDFKIRQQVHELGIADYVTFHEPVAHSESISLQRSKQILLLIANNSPNVEGILTGKFYEYLGAQRPILAIGMHGSNLETEMTASKSGAFFSYKQEEQLKSHLLEAYNAYQSNTLMIEGNIANHYQSEYLASKFIELL